MKIELKNIGKKYNREWIFRGVDYIFESPGAYAILGNNGSGKSTLLQLISSRIVPADGTITYSINGNSIAVEQVYRHFSMAAPYQELLEEFTLPEMLEFHVSLKPLFKDISTKDFIQRIGYPRLEHKELRYYSSGMKQRLKLALAILSDVPVVLLDEPCSNLDRQGMTWYNDLVKECSENRLFIVCSNHQPEEISFCTSQLVVNDYK
ncbi:MAG: ATP-binding cassette domain-containing protein [Bacteroidales bacterium]